MIFALLVVSVIIPSLPAFIFVGVTVCHELLFADLDGLAYYGSAALFDLAIIIITSAIRPVPRLVVRLHRICIVSILLNLVGWTLWTLYYPPILYDAAFFLVYAWAIITLTGRDGPNDMGGYTLVSRIASDRCRTNTRYSSSFYYGGEI